MPRTKREPHQISISASTYAKVDAASAKRGVAINTIIYEAICPTIGLETPEPRPTAHRTTRRRQG